MSAKIRRKAITPLQTTLDHVAQQIQKLIDTEKATMADHYRNHQYKQGQDSQDAIRNLESARQYIGSTNEALTQAAA